MSAERRSITDVLPVAILQLLSLFLTPSEHVFTWQYINKICRRISYGSSDAYNRGWRWDDTVNSWIPTRQASTSSAISTTTSTSLSPQLWRHMGIPNKLTASHIAKSWGPFRISCVTSLAIQIESKDMKDIKHDDDHDDVIDYIDDVNDDNVGEYYKRVDRILSKYSGIVQAVTAAHFHASLKVLHIYALDVLFAKDQWRGLKNLTALESVWLEFEGSLGGIFTFTSASSLIELKIRTLLNTDVVLRDAKTYTNFKLLTITDTVHCLNLDLLPTDWKSHPEIHVATSGSTDFLLHKRILTHMILCFDSTTVTKFVLDQSLANLKEIARTQSRLRHIKCIGTSSNTEPSVPPHERPGVLDRLFWIDWLKTVITTITYIHTIDLSELNVTDTSQPQKLARKWDLTDATQKCELYNELDKEMIKGMPVLKAALKNAGSPPIFITRSM